MRAEGPSGYYLFDFRGSGEVIRISLSDPVPDFGELPFFLGSLVSLSAAR